MITLALACALAGCAQAGDHDYQGEGEEPAQVASMFPTPVTKADYEDAVHLTSDCMGKTKVQLVNYGWDPIDQQGMILIYRAPGVPKAEVSDTARKCRAQHLDAVEARYKHDHEAFMAPKLMKIVQGCLTTKGISLTGQERNPEDLLEAVPEDKLVDLLDCVHPNANKLYPGLPIEFP
ncbi:hypothetical protein [Streptosporangium sp. NPDC048865]|uniref:hypothetical protein n=1 Tax=Streptosporangium sp. NPDC048865 TaxID=3155766 RepID=UPI003438F812